LNYFSLFQTYKQQIKQLENTLASGGTISGSTTTGRRGAGNDVDSKAEEGIHEMSRERRVIVEQLTEERVQ
jgi:hypothetical protein